MPYCDKSSLAEYLNFSDPQDPVRAVVCPYAQDAGAGMGLTVFALLFFGIAGLALTIRIQHPSPLLVAGILTGGVAALSIPGLAAKVLAMVLFVGLSGLGLYLYQRSQGAL